MRIHKNLLFIAVSFVFMTLLAQANENESFLQAKELNNLGLYEGKGNTRFIPALDENLTREEACIMVVRLFGVTVDKEDDVLPNLEDAKKILKRKFTDFDSISDWAIRHVAYGVNEGYINGFPDGTFRPKKNINGLDYSTLILANLGYDFEYHNAGKTFYQLVDVEERNLLGLLSEKGDINREAIVKITSVALNAKYSNSEDTIYSQITMDPTQTHYSSAKDEVQLIFKAGYEGKENIVVANAQSLIHVGTIQLESNKEIEIESFIVLKNGLSKDDSINNITIWDGDIQLNGYASLYERKSRIILDKPLSLKSNEAKELLLMIDMKDDVQTGEEIKLDIQSITFADGTIHSEIETSKTSGIKTVNIDLGTISMKRSSDEPISQIEVGVKDIKLAKFELTNNKERKKITRIIVDQNGTVSEEDLVNIRLYEKDELISTGVVRGQKVIFELDKELKDDKIFLTIVGDILGGTGRIVQFGLNKDFNITAFLPNSNQKAVVQLQDMQNNNVDAILGKERTIKSADFIITKVNNGTLDNNLPNIVDDYEFVRFKLKAIGENIRLTKMFIEGFASNGAADISNITDLKIHIGDTIIAEKNTPFTDAGNDANQISEIPLNNPYDLALNEPVEVFITGDITSDKNVLANEVYKIGLDGDNNTLNGIGLSSARNIKYSLPADIIGSEMTVEANEIIFTQIPESDKSVVRMQNNVKIVGFQAQNKSNQDIELSTIVVEISDYGDDNASTFIGSNFGKFYLIQENGAYISQVYVNPLAESREGNFEFGLLTPIELKANSTFIFKMVADIASNATTSNDYQFGIDSLTSTRIKDTSLAVPVQDLPAGGKVLTIAEPGASLVVERSVNTNLENQIIIPGTNSVIIGAYEFYSSPNGNEGAIIKKLKLRTVDSVITTGSTKEQQKINFAGVATKSGKQYFTIVNETGSTAVALDILYGETAAVIAANLKKAITISNVGNLYSVEASSGDVLVTSYRDGDIAVTSATVDIEGITTTITDNFVSYVAPTVSVIGANDKLGSQEMINIRVVNDKGSVLGKIDFLDSSQEITLTSPIVIEAYDENVIWLDRRQIINILADIPSTASYPKKIAIRLGDGNNGNDIEYSASITGESMNLKKLDVVSAELGKDAVITTGAAKVTVTPLVLADSSPLASSTSGEVAKFKLTNNSTKSIVLTKLQFLELNTVIQTADWDNSFGDDRDVNFALYNVEDGSNITGAFGTDDNIFTISGDSIKLAANESKDYSVQVSLAAVSDTSDNSAPPVPVAGVNLKIKIESDGSTYKVLDGDVEMNIYEDATFESISTK